MYFAGGSPTSFENESKNRVREAGDVAHVVYTGRDDVRQFLAIDVWPASTNIEGFYGDPNVQAAFAQLFDAPPTIGIYQSTRWHQW